MKRTMTVVAFLMMMCATTASAADVGETIRGLVDTFDSQMRAGNIDGFMALYADDAVLLPPNAPAFKGAAEIRKFWGGLLAMGKTDVDLIVEDVYASGDLAIERGRFEVTTPFKDSGKYIVVWRNRNGKWQIIDDIFNSNQAMTEH